jgi:hypothetical protein
MYPGRREAGPKLDCESTASVSLELLAHLRLDVVCCVWTFVRQNVFSDPQTRSLGLPTAVAEEMLGMLEPTNLD